MFLGKHRRLMVGFSEDLKTVTTGQACNIRRLADEMGETDRDDFLAAVDSPEDAPTNAILRAVALGEYEQKIGKRSMKAHREHRCVCFEEIA